MSGPTTSSDDSSKSQVLPAPAALEMNNDGLLSGKRILFIGKLGGLNRREAITLIREQGALAVTAEQQPNLVVLGAEESPLAIESLLGQQMRRAANEGMAEIVTETEFWERLGFVPPEGAARQLYTPAMLADLLSVPVNVIRRWHRRRLIVPVREVHRLPYFDFEEVAAARHLAKLLAAGASPAAIESKLEQLSRWLPHVDRPLAQLSVIVAGRDLLLRQGEGLVDATGQRRFDFELPSEVSETAGAYPIGDQETEGAGAATDFEKVHRGQAIFAFPEHRVRQPDASLVELLDQAADLEDAGNLQESVDTYRAALAVGGPNAEINFLIAELLYRMGDVTAARERYYTSLELDEDYVEARANLGCVLAETGQLDLAVAAFEGTLARHGDYPDVHYHLARTLDEMLRTESADEHWRDFLRLAPDSPWADEARDRLGLDVDAPKEPTSFDSV